MAKLFIGTSGWAYGHWAGPFYPNNLPSKDKLKYYSQYFKTVEINYSFYHLSQPSVYQKWHSETPTDFIFAVKASRFITHIKKLKGVKTSWKFFLENALYLKGKLGPILFQFSPSFPATTENIKRLEDFLKFIRVNQRLSQRKLAVLRYAFEFRHQSWCDEKIYQRLKKCNVAWVIADSPSYPKVEVIISDFVYIRMHGSRALFSSKYTNRELKILAQKIKTWLKRHLDVYVYFNNDARGFAVENAKTLSALLGNFKT